MTGEIFMTPEEVKLWDLFNNYQARRISLNEFSFSINKSQRQSLRVIKKLKLKGFLGLKHGNCFVEPKNKRLTKVYENEILNIYKDQYRGFNAAHFQEQLKEKHGIKLSYSSIYRILSSKKLIKYPHKRKRLKKYMLRPRCEKIWATDSI